MTKYTNKTAFASVDCLNVTNNTAIVNVTQDFTFCYGKSLDVWKLCCVLFVYLFFVKTDSLHRTKYCKKNFITKMLRSFIFPDIPPDLRYSSFSIASKYKKNKAFTTDINSSINVWGLAASYFQLPKLLANLWLLIFHVDSQSVYYT